MRTVRQWECRPGDQVLLRMRDGTDTPAIVDKVSVTGWIKRARLANGTLLRPREWKRTERTGPG